MPTVNPSSWGPKPQFELSDGTPAVGNKLFSYVAGSVNTKQNTYTDRTGTVANANPLVLNALGMPTTEWWFQAGLQYKIVYAPSTDTDPPTSPIWSVDYVSGQNDVTATQDQWVSYSGAPTYVSATSFTLVGDQTSTFQVGRRVKTTNTGGTIYSTITVSAFGALTTITVVNDSGTLDSGLSAVSYGLLSSANTSSPVQRDNTFMVADDGDPTKKLAFQLSSITTATTRTLTAPDQSGRMTIVPFQRSYLSGCTLSTAGASATMSIAAGVAVDTTFAAAMVLTAIAKTTSAWALGTAAGGLDTGAIANSTWYHFYVIQRLDTNVVDAVFSTNATLPTLPTNYTVYRRIGSGLTNGAAQWTAFIQDGDLFQWLTPVNNVNTANPGTSAVSATLTTPLGVNVVSWLSVYLNNQTTNTVSVYLSDLATTDAAPSTALFSLYGQAGSAFSYASGEFFIRTNTSSQIRYRFSASGANDSIVISTKGWRDTRGRDA